MSRELLVGEVESRTGVSISSLHLNERKKLIRSNRTAQRAGLSLSEIADAAEALPKDKAISTKDWGHISTAWRNDLDERIKLLTSLRDELAG